MMKRLTSIATVLLSAIVIPAAADDRAAASPAPFTIAVIPDTQNYLDYRHQPSADSPVDGKAMFLGQMRYIRDHLRVNGGDIAFVVSVGDVWQHQSLEIDEDHHARGFRRTANPVVDPEILPVPETQSFELPLAREGYGLIDGQVPFGVAPGNHDYDAFWTDANHPPRPVVRSRADAGLFHVGGLDNFRSVFGADSAFFKDKPWYVTFHDGGADSAQIFEASGYRFLHIVLQFDPTHASLAWADEVISRYPGLPTIVTTHNYLNIRGERLSDPSIDSHVIDPDQNTPQMVWDKFIRRHDQIFMVLCGHQAGQAFTVSKNEVGHAVYQILANYQDRVQVLKEAGVAPRRGQGLGDGWMRLMRFDLRGPTPSIEVRTYSTHYEQLSSAMKTYAAAYKAAEKPGLSDEAFLLEENFIIALTDFRARFGQGSDGR